MAFDFFANLEIFVSYASLWKPWLPLTARVGKYHSKLASYTPDTAKPRIDEVMRFIAPSQYNAVYPELAVIAKEAKDNTISQYFIPQRIVLQGNRVTAKGMLTRYVQDKQTFSAQAEHSLVFGINSGRFEIESYQKVESQRSGG